VESKRRRTVIQKCRPAPAVIHVLQNVAIYIISIPDRAAYKATRQAGESPARAIPILAL